MMMVLKARNEQNLTQSDLAERTGLRQSNISRIDAKGINILRGHSVYMDVLVF